MCLGCSATFKQKAQVHSLLNEIILKASRQGSMKAAQAKIDRIALKQAEFMANEVWNPRATKAVRNAVNAVGEGESKFTKSDLNKVLSALDKGFQNIENSLDGRLKKDTKAIFEINREAFVSQHKLKPKKKTTKKAVDAVDSEELIVSNLARIQKIAIGNHFPVNKRSLISELIKTGVMEKGLNKTNAGNFLMRELTARLGGQAFKEAIPESFTEAGEASIGSYFRGLASTHASFARNFSQVDAMDEAGITSYQWESVMDELTSTICEEMNGRVFSMQRAKDHMAGILACEDVEALKDFAPWREDLSEFGLTAGKELDSPTAEEVLASNGMAMPPAHLHCRSEVVPL